MQNHLRFLATAILLVVHTVVHAAVTPADLRCEYLKNPLGIDTGAPRLSWKLTSSQRDQRQSAYRILAATALEKLKPGRADLWDSGTVRSSESLHIRYAGRPLGSRQRCWWSVQAWDAKGRPSAWSKPAWFETALLKPADWKAKWIGYPGEVSDDKPIGEPASYFRKGFRIEKPVRSARAYVCGLGMYEMSLNGKRVGDHRFGANQTDYDRRSLKKLLYPFDDQTTKRVLYETFDVTTHLRLGSNAAGMVLGNGWYNQRDRKVEGWMWYGAPRLICQIEIVFRDGTKQTVASDETWRCARGPIGANSIFVGEEYDARNALADWDEPIYEESGWQKAVVVRAPDGPLHAQTSPPDRIAEVLTPISTSEPKPGTRLFDLGQNATGWARIKVQGPRGAMVRLSYKEELGEDYDQTDSYTLSGLGDEVWEPRFTWHGFRTVEVSGLTAGVRLLDLKGVVVHTDVDPAGTFACSNALLNRIQANYVRTQLNNMHMGFPSDCPHRERLGYTGDGQIAMEAAIFNLDMPAFYAKWLQDIRDVQNRNTGYVSHTAPFGGGGGGPAWGSAAVIMPWKMYLYYGDREQLARSYPGMKKWVDYLGTRTDKDGIVVREEPNGWCLGDWATPDKLVLPPELVNTAYYARVARMTGEAAAVLGNAAESKRYLALAEGIAAALNKRFLQEGRYSVGRQGADLFPYAFGLTPPEQRATVLTNIARNTEVEQKEHLDTGILATPLLLDVLTDNGRADLVYIVASQTTHPGWGYALGKGATTIWESWNGDGSHSHPMYGSISAWFFSRLAGIRPGAPGFKEVVIRPETPAGLDWATAAYDSARGRIESRWDREGAGVRLRLTIPANTTALVYLPAADTAKVTEDGRPVSGVAGLRFLRREGDRLVYRVGSGQYNFLCARP